MSEEQNPISLFVTHAWSTDDEYLRAFEFLESSRHFYYRNLSRPLDCPNATRQTQISALQAQMEKAEVVLVLAAQYADSAFWIDHQVATALAMRKPLVLLPAFGSNAPAPVHLLSRIGVVVNWSERALVQALRRQARPDTPLGWDTIDFTMD